jgi:sugar lactone lactonase YvrE
MRASFRPLATLLACLFVTGLVVAGCGGSSSTEDDATDLAVAARFDTTQITGVAVSGSGRLFVNAPFWQDGHTVSVLEVTDQGPQPFPNATWNRPWREGEGLDPARQFVCVQSVYVDPRNPETLWVLDPASPKFGGVVPGGAKLVEVDLSANEVVRTIPFDSTVAPTGSYLNDVRVTADQRYAYVTDSNLGALIVVDLADGTARRVLDDHPSTAADSTYRLTIGDEPFTAPGGQTPQIASDGIALTRNDEHVYYHALTGTHLYRIPAAALNDGTLSASERAAQVEDLGATVVTDGMIADSQGRIYHTALERDAVMRYVPEGDSMETVAQDERLEWPDSFAFGPDGALYVTTSQIHHMPQYNGGTSTRTAPYRVFKVPAEAL